MKGPIFVEVKLSNESIQNMNKSLQNLSNAITDLGNAFAELQNINLVFITSTTKPTKVQRFRNWFLNLRVFTYFKTKRMKNAEK